MTVVLILLGALLTIGACFATGRLVFRSADLPMGFTTSLQFGAGAALLSAAIFAQCALHLVSTASLTALALAAIGGAALTLRGLAAPQLPRPNLYWIPFAVFGAFYFINALTPEISADGTFYHLAFPARYLRHGGFYRVTTNFYGYLSEGIEMLFLMAFSIGRHSSAALTHLSFLFVLAAGMIAYGAFISKPAAGWLGALIVFTSPVIANDAAIAYNDVALATTLFLLYFVLTRWDRDRTVNWLVVAGILAGFAYAIKYTAFLATPYAIGFVLWRTRAFKSALPLAICAAALIAPWMIKNAITVGNPVSPFLNRVFPNPYVSIDFEDGYSKAMRHFNNAELDWHLPIDLTVTGNRVQGNLGPVFLLAPLALAGTGSPEVRRLLFAGGLFLLPFFANHGTRFLIPCAPFFALALALTLSNWKWAIPVFAIAQVLISWPSVVGLYCVQYNWRLTEWPVAAALRQISEVEFTNWMDNYSLVRMIDEKTPRGSVIYTALPLPEAYSKRDFILNYTGALNQSLEDLRWTPFLTDLQPTVRLTFRPGVAGVQQLRVVQKGGCGGRWSMAEIRWTPDRPAKVTARPEPWYAQWAHDGNPATRWKDWQQPKAGYYWQASFAAADRLDTVEIDASPDASNTCIELQTQTAGKWKTASGTAELQAIPMAGDIRRRITEEFRKQGVTHILIHKDERDADDFERRQADWGITKIGESGPGRLYRINEAHQTFEKSNVSIDLDPKTRNNRR